MGEVELVDGPLAQQLRRVEVVEDVLTFTLAPDADGRCKTITYAMFGCGLMGPRYAVVGDRE